MINNFGYHILRYHGGNILFWFERRGKRYELCENLTLGM